MIRSDKGSSPGEWGKVPDQIRSSALDVASAAVRIPGVVAVSLGGSLASGLDDEASDVDLHVLVRGVPEPRQRAAELATVADPGTDIRAENAWGPEDHLRSGGRQVELIYLDLDEVWAEVERARSVGLDDEAFATALLHTVANGAVLVDPDGELARLRAALAAYPEPTYRRLTAELPRLLGEYLTQLTKAHTRGDLLFVQHRRYTVQAVYFTLLFALNRCYHPGEKRLIVHGERCTVRPADQSERWNRIARLAADDPALVPETTSLVDDLLQLVGPPDASPMILASGRRVRD